jgi:ubiquinone/menaquinone biosynthesis C-methylase UbiE
MEELKKVKFLHVGCGTNTKESTTRAFNSDEWEEIRFDIDEYVNPDIVGTMTDMRSVESGSVDAIYSSHNIEHLYPHEVGTALQEFYRVLNENGFVMLTCPDLQSVCKLVAEDRLTEPAYISPAGPIAPIDMLYGFRPSMAGGNLYMSHRSGFTQKTLVATFKKFRFESVACARREECFDLFCLASKKLLTEDELVSLAKRHFP